MNVRDEINTNANESDKAVLLWLFERYHMESQWHFVACCTFERYGNLSYQAHRIWKPTPEGVILYSHAHKMED